jgi:hypothetical protein
MKDPKLNHLSERAPAGRSAGKTSRISVRSSARRSARCALAKATARTTFARSTPALSEDMRNTAAAQGPRAPSARSSERTRSTAKRRADPGRTDAHSRQGRQPERRKSRSCGSGDDQGRQIDGRPEDARAGQRATVKSGAWNEIAATLDPFGRSARQRRAATSIRRPSSTGMPTWPNPPAGCCSAVRMASSASRSTASWPSTNGFMKVNALRNTSNTAGNLTAAGTVGTMAACRSEIPARREAGRQSWPATSAWRRRGRTPRSFG